MLNEKLIQEFKEIYFKEYGIELSAEESVKKATGLFNLFKQLALLGNKRLLDTSVLA